MFFTYVKTAPLHLGKINNKPTTNVPLGSTSSKNQNDIFNLCEMYP